MNQHVIIEGASCTAGFGDEEGKHGFGGRIVHHLTEHSREGKRRKNWGSVDNWTHAQNFGRAVNYLPEWGTHMPGHLVENFSLSSPKDQARRLGIFVLEGHPLVLQRKYDTSSLGGRSLKERWRDSLEYVKDTCRDRDMLALFVQMPPPERNISQQGRQIHQELTGLAIRTAVSMDDDGTFVSASDMFGNHPIEPFMSDDRMHPNARGHELIYRNLLPIIYEKLELELREPFPDPAELFESNQLAVRPCQ